MTEKTSLDPASEALVRKWFTDGNLPAILSMFEVFKSQRDRAEHQVAAYLHHIKILTERADAVIKPMLEKGTPRAPAPTKAKASKPKDDILDIDIQF